ncbi:MAG: ATP-binding cassette domain-containing protein, partial [Chloroflexota bacterium]
MQLPRAVFRRHSTGLESGSGKTTLARSIVALYTATDGTIELLGGEISNDIARRSREQMRNLQMVFQNPHDALNPYITVGQAIGRTIKVLNQDGMGRNEIRAEVDRLLRAVGLTEQYATRFPNQLSGGEK